VKTVTREEIFNIASKMDEETRLLIDKEVAERLEILKEGDLSESELEEMEEYLYASLVLQEFLNGEYELLEEDRQALFDEMEEMYNKYSDLLVRAKIEEKVGKKKRMTLELMKIRERLMENKNEYRNIKNKMKANREDHKKLNDLTKKSVLKDLAKQTKEYNKEHGNALKNAGKGKAYKPPKEERYAGIISGMADALAKGYDKTGAKTSDSSKSKDFLKNERTGILKKRDSKDGPYKDFLENANKVIGDLKENREANRESNKNETNQNTESQGNPAQEEVSGIGIGNKYANMKIERENIATRS
jgi:hypothetical protein